MNICVFATTYPRYPGDHIPSFIHGQLRALAERDHNVHIFVPHDPNANSLHDEQYDGIHVHRFHYWWPHSWEKLCYGAGIPHNVRSNSLLAIQLMPLLLGFYLRAFPFLKRCDVVHGHWTFGGIAAWGAKKSVGIPMVLTTYGAEIVVPILRPVNRILAQEADVVIAISKYTRRILKSFTPNIRPIVIPYGYNTEKIAPPEFDPSAFRQAKGLEANIPLILSVGRLVPRKGFHVLVDAAAHLLKQQSVQIFIGGRGPESDNLQNQIEALGIQDYVHLLGFIDDDELAKWYATADVFVLPAIVDDSGDTEGLGMVLVEAMANGTPVVGSATGGILDIVKHEKSGLLAQPGDAHDLAYQLDRLLNNRALYERLRADGMELAEQSFSWLAITDKLLACYESIT